MAKRNREKVHLKHMTRSQKKENVSNTVPVSVSSEVTTFRVDQQNECSVCMGKYEDDLIDGKLQNEWICCTGYSSWMHIDCLVSENSIFVCFV